ncbi:MAG: toll/interleukin-1 receptor domain-containing protein [Chitinophagaceae bacterium]
MSNTDVFLSYAWEGESEIFVNDLDQSLKSRNLVITRDKRDLGYKGSITDFMKKIGAGKAVVVVISDDYLKSPYCMFELLQIYRNHDFMDRTFQVVLPDAAIFDPRSRMRYVEYWHEKKTELETIFQQFGPGAISAIGDDYKNYDNISSRVGEILSELADSNALSPQIHKSSNFSDLYNALIARLDKDARYTREKNTQKLLSELFTGSKKRYSELTGMGGPYQHLNITEAIWRESIQSNPKTSPTNH